MCIWKGWSVHAWGEGGCVYEGVQCACMGRRRECVCIWKGWSVHGEREDVCIWKYGKAGQGLGTGYVHGEREGVYMEGVECAWGEVGCVYGRGGVCMHGERESVHAWGGGVCVHMEGVEYSVVLV